VFWDDQVSKEYEFGPYSSEAERLRMSRAIMAARPKSQNDPPEPSATPLTERIRQAAEESEAEGHGMRQQRFVELGGVDLVLYFERLPDRLAELPFVDTADMPEFPHHPERGIRPSGGFFDLFNEDEEQVVWAHAAADFEAFGYGRFHSGLPEEAPHALWIR